MKGFECVTCGSKHLQQIRFGNQIADVIEITVDDGLLCSSAAISFEPSEHTVTKFRCGACFGSVEVSEKDIVNFLRFGGK